MAASDLWAWLWGSKQPHEIDEKPPFEPPPVEPPPVEPPPVQPPVEPPPVEPPPGGTGGDLEDPPPIGTPPDDTDRVPGDGGPDPVLFRRSQSGFKPTHGLLILIVQAALKAANHYTGELDGYYGASTEAAVIKFQEERGVNPSGALTESDWTELTGRQVPSVFDRCLQLTASFEGHGFELVVGNFDGAYVTWGITGYTLKHDLPGFIKKLDAKHPGLVSKAFKHLEPKFRRILSASDAEKRRWGDSVSVKPRKYKVRSDWKAAFARLGRFPQVQRLQIEDVLARHWKIALRDARRWGGTSALDIALWFDTAVQNGGGHRDSIANPLDRFKAGGETLSDDERRLRWARIIADGSNPRYIGDVYSRRSTIASSTGTVHGSRYRLEDWGLTPYPIDLEKLADVHATFLPAGLLDIDINIDINVRPRDPDGRGFGLEERPWTAEISVRRLPQAMRDDINRDLNGTGNNLMLSVLGRPKASIGTRCSSSNLYPNFRKHLVWSVDVGPFKVSGLRPAVELLTKVMDDIREEEPEIYGTLSSAGMLCVRRVRGGRSISNHSWGTAIDLMINGRLDARGDNEVQYGLTRIYPIFNRHGFYWGIDFGTEDAMHFEVSRQKMEQWHREGMFGHGSSIPPIANMLDMGDRGPEVRKLQKHLNLLLDGELETDGSYGRDTRTLVLDFQRQHGLEVDGVAGPKTLAAIAAEIAKFNEATS